MLRYRCALLLSRRMTVGEALHFATILAIAGSAVCLTFLLISVRTWDWRGVLSVSGASLILFGVLVVAAMQYRLSTDRVSRHVNRLKKIAGIDCKSGAIRFSEDDFAALDQVAEACEQTFEQLHLAHQHVAAFQTMNTAGAICDADGNVLHSNDAFARTYGGEFDAPTSFANPIFSLIQTVTSQVDLAALALSDEVQFAGEATKITVKGVESGPSAPNLLIVECTPLGDARIAEALLRTAETKELRADFDAAGRSTRLNASFKSCLGDAAARPLALTDFAMDRASLSLVQHLENCESVSGRFHLPAAFGGKLLDGTFHPVIDGQGRRTGAVFMGVDQTDSLRQRTEEREQRDLRRANRRGEDTAIIGALTRLADGDIEVTLEDAFQSDREPIRLAFNHAVQALHHELERLRMHHETLERETGRTTEASGRVSHFAQAQSKDLVALAEISADLTAMQADTRTATKAAGHVTQGAQAVSHNSNSVVQDTIDAMARIENSSAQIEGIVGTIQKIAFQTNILALNAGIEAARAGDAGRGFAVVASEVRDLAQRSSDAAREISTLVGTSNAEVKEGAALVERAGDTLSSLSGSIDRIASELSKATVSMQSETDCASRLSATITKLDSATSEIARHSEMTEASVAAILSSLKDSPTEWGDARTASRPCEPLNEPLCFVSSRTPQARIEANQITQSQHPTAQGYGSLVVAYDRDAEAQN